MFILYLKNVLFLVLNGQMDLMYHVWHELQFLLVHRVKLSIRSPAIGLLVLLVILFCLFWYITLSGNGC